MFTGIVQGKAEVVSIERKTGLQTHTLRLPNDLCDNLTIGASIAHNGCCLTITEINDNLVSFDLMQMTLSLTNLGDLMPGDFVNVERAAKFGDEIGGHNMSGHIMQTTTIVELIPQTNNLTVWFSLDEHIAKYVLTKGYIGLDGCSLTISNVEENRFSVSFIPETLQKTLFGTREVGDRINVEIDPQTQAIVDTVERVLSQRQ
ncbi:riboflavin synthase subunit alpha [Vibrio sp. WJH972]